MKVLVSLEQAGSQWELNWSLHIFPLSSRVILMAVFFSWKFCSLMCSTRGWICEGFGIGRAGWASIGTKLISLTFFPYPPERYWWLFFFISFVASCLKIASVLPRRSTRRWKKKLYVNFSLPFISCQTHIFHSRGLRIAVSAVTFKHYNETR